MPLSEQRKIYKRKYNKTYNQIPDQKEKRKKYNSKYEAIPKNKIRRKKLFLEKRKYVWEILGAKCQKCGYNKCIAALHFHHKNPNDKKNHKDTFGIWLSSKSLSFVLEKIKSTPHKILCANCHAEEHDCEKSLL